jgi:hypothetical protein
MSTNVSLTTGLDLLSSICDVSPNGIGFDGFAEKRVPHAKENNVHGKEVEHLFKGLC